MRMSLKQTRVQSDKNDLEKCNSHLSEVIALKRFCVKNDLVAKCKSKQYEI